MRVVYEIVTGACLQLGFRPTAEEADEARKALNLLLVTLASSAYGLYSTARESFTLSPGDESYTIGPGGDFDTAQPVRIVSAFTREAGIDCPLESNQLTAEEYAGLASKTRGGRPEKYFFERGADTGTLLLYPAPDKAYELHVYSHKPLAQYNGLGSRVGLPPEYEPVLKYNLAVELAGEFGLPIPPQVAVRAEQLLADLKRMNTRVPAARDMPFAGGGRFDIGRGF